MAWPQLLVVLLAAYLPLEEFILKWMPVSGGTYLALRQLPDLAVAAVAVLYLPAVVRKRGSLRVVGRGAEGLLIAFLAIAVVGAVTNGASAPTVSLNIKALLRYVLIAYVLLNTGSSSRTRSIAVGTIGVSVAIQVGVGLVELWGGTSATAIFLPRDPSDVEAAVSLSFTAFRESERGFIFGTVGNTIGFAMFLLVGLTLLLSTRSGWRVLRWPAALVLVFLLYRSGSRASLLAGLSVAALFGWRYHRRATLVVGMCGAVAAALLVALYRPGILRSVGVLVEDYRLIAINQRLGIMLEVLPEFLTWSSAAVLTGLTADRELLAEFVSRIDAPPIILVENVATIEDVYWVALLIYYGVLGLACLVGFLAAVGVRLYGVARGAQHTARRRCAEVSLLLMGALLFLNLFNQALEVRLYSYYLWMLVGLALAPDIDAVRVGAGPRLALTQGSPHGASSGARSAWSPYAGGWQS